jgi:non-specific protein-tyrosine kinase
MELQNYLAIFWRRKWIIVATALITLIGVAVATFLATPIYTSSTTLRVATVGASTGGRPDIDYTLRLMNTYANIVKSRTTRQELRAQLNLQETPTLTVLIIPSTELMQIEAEATDPEVARDIAALAAEIVILQSREQLRSDGESTQDILGRQLTQIETELAEARAEYDQLVANSPDNTSGLAAANQAIQLKERTLTLLLEQYESARLQEALQANSVYVVEPANTPNAPSKPRTQVNLAVGLLVGLILGVGLAFLVDLMDSTLYTASQIEAVTKLPTVGRIPVTTGRTTLVSGNGNGASNGYQPQLEAFRRLRVNLLASASGRPPKTLLLTSADIGEGKSTVTANLAVAIAKSGRSVVTIDCDLHVPTLHTLFKLPNEFGLTSVLTKQVSVAGVVQKSSVPNLYVITSGPALPDPAKSPELKQITPSALANRLEQGTELLGSQEMESLIEQLKREFDVVLLDTPALLSVTDAAVLAPLVDMVVLVVATERSHRDAVRMVREQLDSAHAKAIGVVINRDKPGAQKYAYRVR